MNDLWLRGASVAPGVIRDLLIRDGIVSPAPALDPLVVDLDGRPVLPGIVDHHIHLLALAAAQASVPLDPAALAEAGSLASALRSARSRSPEGWLRGVGYDVEQSGPLDRTALDSLAVSPVRIQDRTGRLWMLDTAGLGQVLPPERAAWPDGVERDGTGEPNGRLWRLDGWLRERLPVAPADLGAVGRFLASRGVTAVTDASAHNGPAELVLLARAGLPQRVTAMTAAPRLSAPKGVALGPVKILLDEADLPALDDLADRVAHAHGAGRAVAVHCVDAAALILALTSGLGPGDRVEHASDVPDDVLPLLAASGAIAVVQPGLVASRGDRYLAQHAEAQWPALHRLRSLQAAGVPVALSSDAPYGDPDPWRTIAAAVRRRTAGGAPFGPGEALSPRAAVAAHTGAPDRPASPARLDPGEPADLLVLDTGWEALAAGPPVMLTVVGGRVVHRS